MDTHTPAIPFGQREFECKDRDEIQQLLESKLPAEHLASRPGAGSNKFTYVESYKVIEMANSIFGFNGWSSSIVDIVPDFVEEVAPNKFRCGVTAVVKVMLKDGTFHEDVGYGLCEHNKKGNAIENAKKEAVTDARKRALRLFGNALGNCIYDKQHVTSVRNQTKGFATKTVTYRTLREAAAAGELDEQYSPKQEPAPAQSPSPPRPQQQQQQQQQQQLPPHPQPQPQMYAQSYTQPQQSQQPKQPIQPYQPHSQHPQTPSAPVQVPAQRFPASTTQTPPASNNMPPNYAPSNLPSTPDFTDDGYDELLLKIEDPGFARNAGQPSPSYTNNNCYPIQTSENPLEPPGKIRKLA